MTADVLASAPVLLDGRYELRDILGRGGMATVHAARDHTLGRDVAIKLLRDPADATHRARFITEARTLARLQHAHIVSLLDAGLNDDVPYLVMELAEGRTMSALMQRGPLAPDLVARIGARVADALCHAHATGVVHRDVKPSNILVDDDGHARLADFGIAKLIGETDQHTRTDETVGSPAYLAPEQVTGTAVSRAIDVYSLGLVLLEALTGRRTYEGTPVEAAIARLQTPPLIPVSLGPTWCTLLERMTRLEPAQRPTAAHVAATLTALIDDSPVGPDDGDPLEQTGAFLWSLDASADQDLPTTALAYRKPTRSRTRRISGGLLAAGAIAAAIALGLTLTAPAPTTAVGSDAVPVPNWSARIFDLLAAPAVEAAPAAVAPARASTPVRSSATPRRAPAPRKAVVPGHAKKAAHPGKGVPGKPGHR